MTGLVLALTLIAGGFTSEYPRETESAVRWCTKNPWAAQELEQSIGAEAALWALSIVAPEIGQWGSLRTKIEYGTLYNLYIHYGKGDFSVGPFQMKPSFAEDMESRHPELAITAENEKETRYVRLGRMSSAEGQLPYLAAFMKEARRIVDAWGVDNPDEAFLYMATLYNGGLGISREKADDLMAGASFPRFGVQKFNYAKAAAEFIPLLHNCLNGQ